MKVQLITPYRASLLQRYGVTVRGKVTSVYPLLRWVHTCNLTVRRAVSCVQTSIVSEITRMQVNREVKYMSLRPM